MEFSTLYSDSGVLAIHVPYLAYTLQPNTAYDWNYTTTPQSGLNGRTIPYPRGRVLGGSSSIRGSISLLIIEIRLLTLIARYHGLDA